MASSPSIVGQTPCLQQIHPVTFDDTNEAYVKLIYEVLSCLKSSIHNDAELRVKIDDRSGSMGSELYLGYEMRAM